MLILVMVVFLVFLVLGMPIAFCMALSAGAAIVLNPSLPATIVAQKIYTAVDSISFIAIPLFMMAGSLMNSTGITDKIIEFFENLVGHITGGLAHAVVLTGMLMAGVSGSSVAAAAAISTIMVPQLEKNGYDRGFAGALISSAGSLGPIIPPSIIMIVYSGVVSISVGKLFMAGLLPGIMLGVMMIIYCYIYAKKRGLGRGTFAGWKAVGKSFLRSFGALVMPLIIIGGIVLGICTATESGILAIIYGICYGFISKQLNIKKLWKSIEESVAGAAQPMIIISFASLLAYVLTYYDMGTVVGNFMGSVTNNGHIILLLIFVIIFIAGMFIESTAILLMLVPFFAPLISVYGFDPIHFATVCIISLVLGGISPPVGIVMYVVSSVTHTDLKRIISNIWPFIIIFSIGVLMVIFVPQVCTWLPSLMA